MEEINKIENKLKRKLNSKENEYVNMWVNQYNYNFEIISIALYYSTNEENPNFKYLNCLIKDWYERGLKTKDDIVTMIESMYRKYDKF